ncbi:Gfo/Idh/MocA family oxidoreductase [Streptomyces sp. ET3-23]|uniref:Gfo/Idh/MocA family protein n=1 Tax=Streptomyces sp. ET3-23 TaxID=2885643 RepID=UPI001D12780D|nr:Gfo/Idh/MocA family oxidoreductase [Streptomyces sp. ET3-23]MCC2274754.1 Gfo/Idh/MocA family oxidoreductase [Streptomyces sp. ET3-23]
MTAVRPLSVGVLGCADIAWRRVLPALAGAGETRVAAVAGRDPEKTRRFAERFGCVPVDGYAALLDRDDVDAVYVPLPAALHAEWVERALLAGKHVLAEKPLTTCGDRTGRLLALARGRGLVLMENVMFVHHRQHAEVRRLVADGAIGELRAFRAEFAVPERPAGDIRHQAALGGGSLLDMGVYPVRAALHFLGHGLAVVGAALHRPADREVDTAGSALLRTPEGVTAHLLFGMQHAYGAAYELWGSRGRIRVDRAFTPPAGHASVLHIDGPDGTERRVVPADDQVVNTVRAFARAVRSGLVPPQDAAACLRQAALLDRIRERAGE